MSVRLAMAGAALLCAGEAVAQGDAASLTQAFTGIAQMKDMVETCKTLDPSTAAKNRRYRALYGARAAELAAKKAGFGGAVSAGQAAWRREKPGVDTSCIVGPEETPQRSYADMLTDLEKQAAAARLAVDGMAKK